jgi:hypothetical protein
MSKFLGKIARATLPITEDVHPRIVMLSYYMHCETYIDVTETLELLLILLGIFP